MHNVIFQGVDYFELEHKHAYIWTETFSWKQEKCCKKEKKNPCNTYSIFFLMDAWLLHATWLALLGGGGVLLSMATLTPFFNMLSPIDLFWLLTLTQWPPITTDFWQSLTKWSPLALKDFFFLSNFLFFSKFLCPNLYFAKICLSSLFDPFFGLLTEWPALLEKVSHQKTPSFK